MLVRRSILALLSALAFATFLVMPCAFALEPCDSGDASSVVTAQSEKTQHYQAILYDDGELVISKSPTLNEGAAEQGTTPEGDPAANGLPNSGETPGEAGQTGEMPSGTVPTSGNESENAATNSTNASNGPEGAPSAEGNAPTQQASNRTKIAVYDDVTVDADCPEHVSWYGSRDKIKRVTFGDGVSPDTLAYWFAGLQNLSDINFKGLDTSRATSMRSLFDGCKSLGNLDARALDTSLVTDMSRLFAGCSALVSLDLSKFKTSAVTSLDSMFEGCASIRSLDLSSFDTRNVASTNGMLKGCTSLAALDVSSFTPAQLSAMAIPTGNSGGFWKMNVPAGYETGVVLREPTPAERMAYSLFPNGNGGSSGRNGHKTAADQVKRDGRAPIGTAASTALNIAATPYSTPLGADVPSEDLIASDFASVIALILARGDGSAAASLSESFINALFTGASVISAVASHPAIDVSTVIESIATPSPSNPMMPIGIPVNLFATTVLLVLIIPTTLLLLRDRRF